MQWLTTDIDPIRFGIPASVPWVPCHMVNGFFRGGSPLAGFAPAPILLLDQRFVGSARERPHMLRFVRFTVIVFAFGLAALSTAMGANMSPAKSAYDFAFTSIDGKPLPLKEFQGKALLVVNTASQCGYTPQYEGLEKLWRTYRDRGLVVLGVPSNDFGGQEPGNAAEIKQFCTVNFDVDFPLADKVPVIGGAAHPFYRWISAELGEDQVPRWNFHKYLIGPDGRIVGTYPSRVEPMSGELTRAIEGVLPR
jgi:glutathione peroxidase